MQGPERPRKAKASNEVVNIKGEFVVQVLWDDLFLTTVQTGLLQIIGIAVWPTAKH